MKQALNYTGTFAGIGGALLCAIAGITRIQGGFYIQGYETTTLFNLGVAFMVFACLAKLEVLVSAKP